MRFLYSLGIYLLSAALKVIAIFNPKIRLGVAGRKETFQVLEEDLAPDLARMWFHCASLGEYEQGLPVFEALKKRYPEHQIVLSFFSPSGYEHKKEGSIADVVVYLPLDTPANAQHFVKLVAPDICVFTKYDLWPNFLRALRGSTSSCYLISALFRPSQPYFKWYGGMMRKGLSTFTHIFTQNKESEQLLNSIGLTSVSHAGDTRFDRVYAQLQMNNSLPFLETFKNEQRTVLFGSSWAEDEALFMSFINEHSFKDLKFIIAPHEVTERTTLRLKKKINRPMVTYSQLDSVNDQDLKAAEVFIMDTIGYLSKAYSYGDIAYVGGAAGHTGLHNILEPAVFGIPVFIGQNYQRFPEAVALVELGGVCSVSSSLDFNAELTNLLVDQSKIDHMGSINFKFIEERSGAVEKIMSVI